MDETRRKRLFQAVEKSYRELEPFRTLALNLVDEYVGDAYGGAGGKRAKREVIVNLLNQTVEAYMMALAANRPRVLVSTKHEQLRPFAAHFQVGLNNLLEEIGIEHTIQRWVLDAFFCVGVVKVHMASSGLVELEPDRWMDPGKPFASNVSLDNFVYDTSGNKWSEVQFAGDVYRIPWEDLQDETVYDQSVAAEIKPTSKSEGDDERIENISRGQETDPDEFLPMVDLIDLWIPREGVIETYPVHFRNGTLTPYGEPVAVMSWDGSEHGPYKLMGFGDVPDNIMPTSPAAHLRNLAAHINNVYRKQQRSARDFKEVTTYTAAGEKSARNAQAAKHGDMVMVNDPQEIGNLRMGGPDQEMQMFLLNMMDHFDRQAGNLTALAGLGSQADTLGQERLVHGAVSGRTGQMAQKVRAAVEGLIKDLAGMMWADAVNVVPGQMQIEGMDGYTADATWRPDDREGDFADYNFQIDVHSMAYKSPSERANAIVQILTQIYAPMLPMLMQQGGIIDFHELNSMLSDLYDLPRLKWVVKFTGAPPLPEETQPMPMGGKPANTRREYIRRSAGGQGHGGNVMQQQAWAQSGAASGAGGGGRHQMGMPK